MGTKPCSEIAMPEKYGILAPSLMTRTQVA
jgi:hypothetical protein